MVRKIILAILIAALPATSFSLTNDNLQALVALPLAVAAVAELPDVPHARLADFVTLLNRAAVPPVQLVEAVRYVPVALVSDVGDPQFVPYLRTRYDEGLRGDSFVRIIEERYVSYGLPQINLVVTAPRLLQYEPRFIIPDVVRIRIVERRKHPHGGPPGQLKKELGLQTGAEVVHGSKPGRPDDRVGGKQVSPGHGKPHQKSGGPGKGHGNAHANKGHGKGKH
jgi:hypothetical protein